MALDSSPPNNSYWFCHLWHSNWLYPAKGLDYEFSIEIGIETNSSVPYRMGFLFLETTILLGNSYFDEW